MEEIDKIKEMISLYQIKINACDIILKDIKERKRKLEWKDIADFDRLVLRADRKVEQAIRQAYVQVQAEFESLLD